MKNLKINSVLIAVLVLVSFTLSAQNNGQGNKGNGQGRNTNRAECNQKSVNGNKIDRMASYLELTEDQKSKIESLKLNHQKKMLPLKNELNEKSAKMRTLQTSENANMNSINSLIDEMAVIKTNMAKDRAAMHQEVRKTLNEDQRIKFDLHASHGSKGGKNGHGKGNKCGKI